MLSVTAEQMRQIDRRAIQEFGIPGVVLMENAGRAVSREVMALLGDSSRSTVVIFCGKGNNGGDGYVVARHLLNKGLKVILFLLAHKDDIKGDARINLDILLKMKLPVNEINKLQDLAGFKADISSGDLIVDAILGTGVKGKVEGLTGQVIEFINGLNKPVLAVDIPSGLDADTGQPLGTSIKATRTVTFVLPKKGFDNPAAKDFVGELIVADIGIPRELLK
ncbi:MAG: NAD(P)H-hydrate epimerase [bacterium]